MAQINSRSWLACQEKSGHEDTEHDIKSYDYILLHLSLK